MSTQPSHNVSGRGIPRTVKTNCFAITKLPDKIFYQYDVILRLDYRKADASGEPKRAPVSLENRYMDIMSKLHDMYPEIFNPRPSYNGTKMMFSSRQINNATFTVNMTSDPKKGAYEVKILLVNTISPELVRYLIEPNGRSADTTVYKRDRSNPDAVAPPLNPNAAAVMLLQLIVIQEPHMKHNFSTHSRSFYIQEKAKFLSRGLLAVPGFFQSVRPVLGKYIINVDTTTAAFYEAGWLHDLAAKHFKMTDMRVLPRELQDQRKFLTLRAFLRRLTVVIVPGNINYRYPPSRDNTYRRMEIRDIVRNAGNIEFMKGTGYVTIKEYWQETHNSTILYPDLFGIKTGSGAIFPAEKCWVLPGQRYNRKLSPADTASFIKHSETKPEVKLRSIQDAVGGPTLNYSSSHYMQNAGLQVDPRVLEIRGREMHAPEIEYNVSRLAVQRGAWNVVNKVFKRAARVAAWAVVCYDAVPPEELDDFARNLANNMVKLGMRLPDKGRLILRYGNSQAPESVLDDVRAQFREWGVPRNQVFILVVLSAEAEPIRRAVKFWGDVKYGVPTQCVRRGKFDKAKGGGLDQYCNNVALKINPRMGGLNSSVSTSSFQVLERCMVVGCDISHPPPGVGSRPSIAGLVASVDPHFSSYSPHVRCQDPRQEVIQDLAGMLSDAISMFRGANNIAPIGIIIYRDGVSEGEYSRVMEDEIGQVEQAINSIQPPPTKPPQVIYIVVGKRHHVRFFPKDQGSGDHAGNCHPGLVVDQGVTHSRFTNFYLLSHAGIKGTSRPSHYVVLRNDPNFPPELLQEISYGLCHVYAPATRSVSIPAPVYYADKLCAHAKYQFEPEDGLPDFDDQSETSDSFNLKEWQSRLRPAQLFDRMYFI